jgi:hypothetical protein
MKERERAVTREPSVPRDAKAAPTGSIRRFDSWRTGEMENGGLVINARIEGESGAGERRRAEREPVDVDARLRELGSEGCDAKVLNISATGFMAEATAEFPVGARVWLILPGRERANAVVRWAEGDRIGAEFAEPIDTSGLLGR